MSLAPFSSVLVVVLKYCQMLLHCMHGILPFLVLPPRILLASCYFLVLGPLASLPSALLSVRNLFRVLAGVRAVCRLPLYFHSAWVSPLPGRLCEPLRFSYVGSGMSPATRVSTSDESSCEPVLLRWAMGAGPSSCSVGSEAAALLSTSCGVVYLFSVLRVRSCACVG